MENILEFIPNLKIIYLILIILVMVIINIILNKRNVASNYKYLINGIVLVIFGVIVNYLSDIVDGIFQLNYLSVKLYIITLIIVNVVTIFTIQRKFGLIYKVLNYLLFGLTSIILIVNILIIGGIKIGLINSSLSSYSIKFIDMSIVIFIIYLTILSIIYIIRNLTKKERDVTKEVVVEEKNKVNIKEIIFDMVNNIKNKKNVFNDEEAVVLEDELKSLSLEELLALPDKDIFSINGVNCSIIFEDSIPDNIFKNYHILLEDINAKMVNGYTLEENKMLKSICIKLQTTSLNSLDLNDLSILNKVSPDEYNFLKQICDR